jgi:hypothetical protein
MARMSAMLSNTLWVASCQPAWQRFRRAAGSLEAVQTALLHSYLRANRNTEYGRRCGFASVASVEDYRRAAPLTTYADYEAAINRIGAGEPNVLTAERVRMFEPSSGSTAASKLIPYTGALQAEFRRALEPWIYDLYTHYPELRGGPSYWSITPLTDGARTTSGGIPIGFEEDSAYLGSIGSRLVDAAMAVPNAVKQIGDIAIFRYVTLLFLLRRPDLRLISVWNPTFLSLLVEPLPRWWGSLCQDIAEGTLSPPGALSSDLHAALSRMLPPDPTRARQLAGIAPGDVRAIWPDLGLISCWADGPSSPYAKRLADGPFAGIRMQPKGLLATEAFVSFPLVGAPSGVLAATSHFFEFQPVDEALAPLREETRLAHQVEEGGVYAVIVTTGGGLYRYQLHDLVQVVGRVGQAPCLQFLGKTDRVSDWFGEKLNEQFVAAVLDRLFRARGWSPGFAMLAPDNRTDGFRYTLYVEIAEDHAPGDLDDLRRELDRELRAGFHYDYCRKLGQLAATDVMAVGPGAAEIYIRACAAGGQKLGNIKPASLHKDTGWRGRFEPIARKTAHEDHPD